MREIKRLVVLQHLEIEGPGLFEQFAKERNLEIQVIRLDKKDALPQTKKGDLILIMGGPMGVKDIGSEGYPWLKLERDFLKKELENKRPMIGVCLGAQLLANAAGGDVVILKSGSPPKAFPEIGWSQIFYFWRKSKNRFSIFITFSYSNNNSFSCISFSSKSSVYESWINRWTNYYCIKEANINI